MQRAVLYARVSPDLQHKEGTIQSQVAELKRQIVEAGHELVHEYMDDGYSGCATARCAAGMAGRLTAITPEQAHQVYLRPVMRRWPTAGMTKLAVDE